MELSHFGSQSSTKTSLKTQSLVFYFSGASAQTFTTLSEYTGRDVPDQEM